MTKEQIERALYEARKVLPVAYGYRFVINARHGGLSLTRAGVEWLVEHGHIRQTRVKSVMKRVEEDEIGVYLYASDFEGHPASGFFADSLFPLHIRSHPGIVGVTEALGEKAWSKLGEPTIVEVPKGVLVVEHHEYDGVEWLTLPAVPISGGGVGWLKYDYTIAILPDLALWMVGHAAEG